MLLFSFRQDSHFMYCMSPYFLLVLVLWGFDYYFYYSLTFYKLKNIEECWSITLKVYLKVGSFAYSKLAAVVMHFVEQTLSVSLMLIYWCLVPRLLIFHGSNSVTFWRQCVSSSSSDLHVSVLIHIFWGDNLRLYQNLLYLIFNLQS